MDSLDGGGFMYIGGQEPQKHPQHKILKKHIERSVQDLFLEALRKQPIELLYVFETEEQIDGFIDRMLSYWEGFEKYETCQDVVMLGKELKNKWNDRDQFESTDAVIRIKDIFKSNFE
jgi:hypothetical protein